LVFRYVPIIFLLNVFSTIFQGKTLHQMQYIGDSSLSPIRFGSPAVYESYGSRNHQDLGLRHPNH
jgi:hypothetical protein